MLNAAMLCVSARVIVACDWWESHGMVRLRIVSRVMMVAGYCWYE